MMQCFKSLHDSLSAFLIHTFELPLSSSNPPPPPPERIRRLGATCTFPFSWERGYFLGVGLGKIFPEKGVFFVRTNGYQFPRLGGGGGGVRLWGMSLDTPWFYRSGGGGVGSKLIWLAYLVLFIIWYPKSISCALAHHIQLKSFF